MTNEEEKHLPGNEILVIAEGKETDHLSDEDMAHVFSCEECSSILSEMRAGLHFLAAQKPKESKSTQSAKAIPKNLEELDDPLDALDAEGMMLELNRQESLAPEDHVKKSILGIAILGALALVMLIFMQMFLEKST